MQEPSNFQKFFHIAALCSLAGAITTILLIFLPNPEASGFEARIQLYDNGLYLSKLWILFLHPQVNFLAALGVAALLFRKYPFRIIIGTGFLMVWAYSEMSQQAFLIDALNQIWRPGYLHAEESTVKDAFYTLITGAGGISDSKYFLVIYGFGLGSLLFGLAFIKEDRLGRWLGWALIFIGLLSLSSFGRYYLLLDFLSPPVDWAYTWIYPCLQPAVRIGIAVWIWVRIKKVV